MRTKALVVTLLAVAVLWSGCTADKDRDPSSFRFGDDADAFPIELASALRPFEACDELLDYVQTEAVKAVDQGMVGGVMRDRLIGAPVASGARGGEATASAAMDAAAPELTPAARGGQGGGDDFSTTNIQEAGVDEPDIVKTDGRRLVTVAGGRLRVLDVSADRPRETASRNLSGLAEFQLLMSDDRVLAFGTAYGPRGAVTLVRVFDLADIESPKEVADLELDGEYVSARLVEGSVKLVLRSQPLEVITPSKVAIEDTSVDDWLPSYELRDRSTGRTELTGGRLVECEDTARPVEFSGLGTVSVVTIDPADPRPSAGASVMGAGDVVYASASHLFVATTTWGATPKSAVHQFDITDPAGARYEASGELPGSPLNQFSMSEYDGRLRVATTNPQGSESFVTVLARDGGTLAEVGRVGGLGKGERIYSVRFIGEKGYVVTFRQTDPLYVIDLADPERPAVKGELKILGYSAYLHPIGEDVLLGVGQDATEQGRVKGTQLSMFDVSDPTNPKRVHQTTLAGGNSEAEQDHHAFLYWPQTGLTVIPLQTYDVVALERGASPAPPFVGAVAFSVERESGIAERARLAHPPQTPIRRSLVVRDALYTLSEAGLLASDLTTLAERSWLPLT